MSTYSFGCRKCGHEWPVEATLRERDAGLKIPCPKCKSPDTRQIFTKVTYMDREDLSDPEMPSAPPGGGMGGMPPGMGGMGMPPGMGGCGMGPYGM